MIPDSNQFNLTPDMQASKETMKHTGEKAWLNVKRT